jgi:hypothetical protein
MTPKKISRPCRKTVVAASLPAAERLARARRPIAATASSVTTDAPRRRSGASSLAMCPPGL